MLIKKNIIRPKPESYGEGGYNPQYCFTDRDELQLYKHKFKRYNPSIQQIVKYLFQRKGIIPEAKAGPGLLKGLDQFYGKASLTKAKVDRKFENAYEQSFGFRISLKRLHGLSEQYRGEVPYVVSSMVPPGRLFQAQPSTGPDVSVIHEIDFKTSRWNSVIYTDDVNFVGLQGQEKLGLVCEVKTYSPKASKEGYAPKHLGWTFFPIFKSVENEDGAVSLYVNAGLHQVPIYMGPVNKKILVTALQSNDPALHLVKEPDLHFL